MSTPKEIDDLITEIISGKPEVSLEIPKKYAPKRKQSKRRCEIHKYIRFRSNNKTYDLNRYYCTKCPSSITIPELLGRTTECWKCKQAFTVGINYFPTKPLCDECRHGKIDKGLIDLIDERLK